mgnify:CR=1 FL=1
MGSKDSPWVLRFRIRGSIKLRAKIILQILACQESSLVANLLMLQMVLGKTAHLGKIELSPVYQMKIGVISQMFLHNEDNSQQQSLKFFLIQ